MSSAEATDGSFLLYGATGYSGSLLARASVARGMRPVLAGRNGAALEKLAGQLDLTFRVAALDDTRALDRALQGIGVVLHAAGPYSSTAAPMLEACMRAGAHYLDLTGEIGVVEQLAARGAQARSRGIMVMPGVGLDVVAGDCLALHTASRIKRPVRMKMGVHGLRLVSRGTAKTIVEAAGDGKARRGGRITAMPLGSVERSFDFGWGPTACLNVSWADVATAWYTTGIPDIEVYCEAIVPLRLLAMSNRTMGAMLSTPPMQAWIKAHVDLLPPGPDEDARRRGAAIFVVEVEDAAGDRAVSRLRTAEAYSFTAMVAPAIAARAVSGDVEAGFQTPARVYGADLPLAFDGVVREDLQ
ncbi:MAG TPA: saccharopine dehydrogenase NADP-binding domain-containing protein [Candidatus Binatia bacterium]|nr:saccharopine dehydrogenase NADP-binding domain-containing protein [Candidatus Binatia bacterium]